MRLGKPDVAGKTALPSGSRPRSNHQPVVAVVAAIVSAVLVAFPGALLAQKASADAQEKSESLDARIDRLIEQLGHDDYSIRQWAQNELAKLGLEAYRALVAASTHDDLEIATRAKHLVTLISAEWSSENEPEEVRRWLTLYESQSSEMRVRILRHLARMPRGEGIPALCRLVRLETSVLWSKRAAIALFNAEPLEKASRERWEKHLLRHLMTHNGSKGAQWLLVYLKLAKDPKQTLARWAELVDSERKLLARSTDRTSPEILACLLYRQALAEVAQHDPETAQKTADRARQVGPSQLVVRLGARLGAASFLQRNGQFRWAEFEYREVGKSSAIAFAARAHLGLSEMLHDMGDHRAAAKAREEVVRLAGEENGILVARTIGSSVGQNRARMLFFTACHWKEQGDRAKQKQLLDESIKNDSAELDTLIARYQLTEQTPEYRQETLDLVKKAAAVLRLEIKQNPLEPLNLNQFAWLVGNTENPGGDPDEALRAAQKAVELRSESGAYLDTLAHVHFHRGELEKAVEFQEKAARFEPNSGLIAGELAVFRKALAEKRKSAVSNAKQLDASKPNANPGPGK